MRAAVALRDGVGEAEHGLVELSFHHSAHSTAMPSRSALIMIGARNERSLIAVDVLDECLDAALEAHLFALLDGMALVGEHDRTPELRKASSRSRCSSVAKSNSVMVKVCGLGRKVTSVPRLSCGSADDGERASASPSRNSMKCSLPSRQMVSLSQVDSALTTETPTPCSPPDTL